MRTDRRHHQLLLSSFMDPKIIALKRKKERKEERKKERKEERKKERKEGRKEEEEERS